MVGLHTLSLYAYDCQSIISEAKLIMHKFAILIYGLD